MVFDGMRCSTCGTDNEPDSRFCGNCGAKVGGSVAPGAFTTKPGPGRVAPTQKIPPGAPLAASMQPQSISGKVRNTPPSMPPPVGSQPVSVQMAPNAAVIPRTSSNPGVQQPVSVNQTSVRPSAPQVQRSQPPRPAASAPSIDGASHRGTSVPRKGRNWPLIVILFIIDLGLAGSGAFMLQRGLVRDDEVPQVKK
jgi:hypothetical protein